MIIKKKAGTYNTYTLEVSWGQLNSFAQALAQDHSDPLSDEAYAEIQWYMQNVPGPGEDEDEYKEAKDAEKQAGDMGGEEMGPDPDYLGKEVEEPAEDEEGFKGTHGAAASGGLGNEPGGGPAEAEADKFLERPPEREPALDEA